MISPAAVAKENMNDNIQPTVSKPGSHHGSLTDGMMSKTTTDKDTSYGEAARPASVVVDGPSSLQMEGDENDDDEEEEQQQEEEELEASFDSESDEEEEEEEDGGGGREKQRQTHPGLVFRYGRTIDYTL